MKDRRHPFVLATTSSFPDDVSSGPYSHKLLDELMARLKGIGISRVNWQYYGGVDPDSYWYGYRYKIERETYGPKTIENIGEPLAAAVQAAHRHGLQIFGQMKPYDFGTPETLPEGSPEAALSEGPMRVGGPTKRVYPFIERHPHVRIRRRPYKAPADLQTLAVKKIRLAKQDDSPTRIRKENLQIWTSPANYRYERRDVEFTLKEAVEPSPRDVRAREGELVTAKGAPVRTLTLEGLDLTDRYILVTTTFEDTEGDFWNTPMAMIEAYGSGPEPLPIEVANRRAWAATAPRDFRSYGLEFDTGLGDIPTVLDVESSSTESHEGLHWSRVPGHGAIAFARGKNEYVAAPPCEAEPEVRKLWGGWVDRIMEAGVDGIDLRFNCHGIPSNEPEEYGFNEVLVEEYGRRFGKDLLAEDADLKLLARLRGEHLTSFVRETSEKVRGAGKKMHMHVHTEWWRDKVSHAQSFWTPANLEFDWKGWLKEGLADGLTLRGGLRAGRTEHIRETPDEDPVVVDVLEQARERDVPVSLNVYVGPRSAEEYASHLEDIFNDDRFAGFIVYEVASILLPTPDGSRLVSREGRTEAIGAKAKELGLV